MNYLVDTHILLWALEGNTKKIGKEKADLLLNGHGVFYASVVSYWELIIKQTLGKIKIPADFIEQVNNAGFRWLNIELEHITELSVLPRLHDDPFDRLLIAQAVASKFILMTNDNKIADYSLHVI